MEQGGAEALWIALPKYRRNSGIITSGTAMTPPVALALRCPYQL